MTIEMQDVGLQEAFVAAEPRWEDDSVRDDSAGDPLPDSTPLLEDVLAKATPALVLVFQENEDATVVQSYGFLRNLPPFIEQHNMADLAAWFMSTSEMLLKQAFTDVRSARAAVAADAAKKAGVIVGVPDAVEPPAPPQIVLPGQE